MRAIARAAGAVVLLSAAAALAVQDAGWSPQLKPTADRLGASFLADQPVRDAVPDNALPAPADASDELRAQVERLKRLRAQAAALQDGRDPDDDPLAYLNAVEICAERLNVDRKKALAAYIAKGLVPKVESFQPSRYGGLKEDPYTAVYIYLNSHLAIPASEARRIYHDRVRPESTAPTAADFAIRREMIAESLLDLSQHHPTAVNAQRAAYIDTRAREIAAQLRWDPKENIRHGKGLTPVSPPKSPAPRAQLPITLKTPSAAPPFDPDHPLLTLWGIPMKDGEPELEPGDAALIYEPAGSTHVSIVVRQPDGLYIRKDAAPSLKGYIEEYSDFLTAARHNARATETPDAIYLKRRFLSDGRASGDLIVEEMRARTGRGFTWCSYEAAESLRARETSAASKESAIKRKIRNAIYFFAGLSPWTLKWAAVELR